MEQIEKLLLDYELSDVQAICQNGDTVVHLVVKSETFSPKKKIEMLKILLDHGVDLNIKNKRNETVMHIAMKNRAKDIVDFLLTFSKTKFTHSVATCLIESERDKLLEFENDPQISELKMQKWENESLSFVEWIMSKNLEIGAYGDWASSVIKFNLQHIFPIFSKYTTTEINKNNNLLREFLQQNKVQRDWYQRKPCNVWYSGYCDRYSVRIASDLLDKQISPNSDIYVIIDLRMAIELEEHVDIIKMLIDRSTDINQRNFYGHTVFYNLIQKWISWKKSNNDYYQEIALALMTKGADVNIPDNSNYSPLCIAVERSNVTVVEFLNENGADFNVITSNGDSLIHLLFKRDRAGVLNVEVDIKLLDILVSKGFKVNAKDRNGRTPLHLAVTAGPTRITEKLIDHKANVNCRDSTDRTPLHYITEDVRFYMAEVLLKHGAYVNATDSYNNTPLRLAIDRRRDLNFTSLFDILLKYGADPNPEFAILPLTFNTEGSYEEEYLFKIIKYRIKLKAAGLKCADNRHYGRHYSSMKYRKFYWKCLKEVETLKSNFIDNAISLYKFLHMGSYCRCSYIKNEKLKNIVGNEPTLNMNFPEYSILILGKYQEAVTKKEFMELAKETWLEITKIALPALCLENVFSFLSNSELFIIVEERIEMNLDTEIISAE